MAIDDRGKGGLLVDGVSGGTGKDPQNDYHISDCAVWADSNVGAGLLGSCNKGYGVVGILGDLTSNAPQTPASAGVWGSSKQGPGVLGISENDVGVSGQSSSGRGVMGFSDQSNGVHGFTNGEKASAVWGENNAGGIGVTGVGSGIGPGTIGVLGKSGYDADGQGIGVKGISGFVGVFGGGGVGVEGKGSIGVRGTSYSGVGVKGTSTSGTGIEGNIDDGVGVKGNGSRPYSTGVQGNCDSGVGVEGNSQDYIGVAGITQSGYAVIGLAGDGLAVAGHSSPGGYAGYFAGPVVITGPLQKPGGSFKIDHPLDPANKYLSHSFIESPDMKNVYDGVAVLNKHGEAVVKFPNWFKALNKDFRYLLTAIGKPGPNLYVAEEIADNRFKIAGGSFGMKVSWQVTGIRQDAWAKAHRIVVEETKTKKERGRFLHPELHGKSEQKSIWWARNPELMRRMKAAPAKSPKIPKRTR